MKLYVFINKQRRYHVIADNLTEAELCIVAYNKPNNINLDDYELEIYTEYEVCETINNEEIIWN